jgi:hypothetical protein
VSGTTNLARSRQSSAPQLMAGMREPRRSGARSQQRHHGMSPPLTQALDACVEAVAGWNDDRPTGARLARVAGARAEPARVVPARRLADAAADLIDRVELLLRDLRWGRQPLFVGVRLAAKVVVWISVLILFEYLLLAAMSENGR